MSGSFAFRFQSGLLSDTAVLSIGTMLAHAVTLAGMPLLSRLYPPDRFGILAVLMAVSSIGGTFVTLRYETTILLPKDERESRLLVVGCVWLASVLSLSIAGTSFLATSMLRELRGIGTLGDWLPVGVLCGGAVGIQAAVSAWLNRMRRYTDIVRLRLAQSSTATAIALLLGVLGASWGLLAGHATSLGVTAALALRKLPGWATDLRRPTAALPLLQQHREAPKFLLPTALLDAVTLQIPVFLITAWFSAQEAGQFSMAWRVVALPMALVGSAIAMIFFQRFSQEWPNRERATKVLFSTWRLLAVAGAIPMLLLIGWGPALFGFVFGAEWKDAGTIAAILAPMFFVGLLHSPTSTTFIVLGMQRHILLFGCAVAVYRPLCLFAGLAMNDLHTGLALLVMAEIVQMGVFQLLALRRLNSPLTKSSL